MAASYITVVQLADLIEDIRDKEVSLRAIALRLREDIEGSKSVRATCEALAAELEKRASG